MQIVCEFYISSNRIRVKKILNFRLSLSSIQYKKNHKKTEEKEFNSDALQEY